MLSVLTGAIEARDPYARGHSARVTALAETVARRLGWSDERLATLRVGGPLHDIGKLAVSDEVLCKEGRLDPDELAQIQEHPKIGARILLRMAALREAIPYVLSTGSLYGSPSRVRNQVAELAEVGVRHLLCQTGFGAMSHEQNLASMRRFGEHVMPAFRRT